MLLNKQGPNILEVDHARPWDDAELQLRQPNIAVQLQLNNPGHFTMCYSFIVSYALAVLYKHRD